MTISRLCRRVAWTNRLVAVARHTLVGTAFVEVHRPDIVDFPPVGRTLTGVDRGRIGQNLMPATGVAVGAGGVGDNWDISVQLGVT